METTIKSRALETEVTFFVGDYGGNVFVDFEGGVNHGTLGRQICEGGRLLGDTLSFYGSQDEFDKFARDWFAAYRRRRNQY